MMQRQASSKIRFKRLAQQDPFNIESSIYVLLAVSCGIAVVLLVLIILVRKRWTQRHPQQAAFRQKISKVLTTIVAQLAQNKEFLELPKQNHRDLSDYECLRREISSSSNTKKRE